MKAGFNVLKPDDGLLHVAVFVHNALDVGGGETAIDLVANHGNRGQTASAHATQTGQRELAVGSGLTHLEVGNLIKLSNKI